MTASAPAAAPRSLDEDGQPTEADASASDEDAARDQSADDAESATTKSHPSDRAITNQH